MIGGDGIEPAVLEALEQRGIVLRRAQRGIHLVVRVVVADVLVMKQQVVRRDLAGDADAAVFGAPDGAHAFDGGDVLDVEMHAGVFSEADVARDADLLADAGYAGQAESVADAALVHAAFAAEGLELAVAGERQLVVACVLHGAAQHLGIVHGVAVVREHDTACGLHAGDARQLFAFAALGDGTAGVDAGADARAAGAFQHAADHARVVDGRGGIGHHDKAGDATIDRGLRTCGDVFLVVLAGLTGMHVEVEKTGKQDAAGAVDDLRIVHTGDACGHANDAVPFDEHVGGLELGTVFAGDPGVAVEAFHEAMMSGRFSACASL